MERTRGKQILKKIVGLALTCIAMLMAIAIGVMLGTVAFAQDRSNTYYAAQFPGPDVGAKITNAQKQCTAGITCIIVVDSILQGWPQGTPPSPCALCIWMDWTSSGQLTITSSGHFPNSTQLSLGTTFHGSDGTLGMGNIALPAAGLISWGSPFNTSLSRQLSGIVQVGDGAADANGGLSLATIAYKRIKATNGTALAGTDFAISAGWGTTATKAVVGTDARFRFSVTSSGTGQTVNPTFTITFHDGAWSNPPICMPLYVSNVAPIVFPTESSAPTTTAVTWLFPSTPVAGSTYTFNVDCQDR